MHQLKINSGVIMLGIILSACGGGSASNIAASSANITVAGAPTLVSLSAADASLIAVFSAPGSNGGAVVSAYSLQCVTGGTIKNASGPSSPISISGLSNGASYSCTLTASNAVGVSAPSNALSAAPAAVSASIDPTHLPLGDGKLSTTTPQKNFVYSCTIPSSTNPPGKAPWINSDGLSWDSTAKVTVTGAVNWTSVFAANVANGLINVSGNGLPNHATGSFPISATDPAYQYDRNPNAIQSVAIGWGLPGNPQVAATPSCTSLGAIGVLLTGARIFNALDADGRDAVAHEVQDSCAGHPQSVGSYHYHSVSSCVAQKDSAGAHSPLVGYIADGFGIYGNLGEAGKPLTNADLDECHGHNHVLIINGASVMQYHYHATKEYPYTVGCYRGTPVTLH
jgi:hypothetical protein